MTGEVFWKILSACWERQSAGYKDFDEAGLEEHSTEIVRHGQYVGVLGYLT